MINESWSWLNESEAEENAGEIRIYAPAKSDWYNNPVPNEGKIEKPITNAPFLYKEVHGDFLIRAKVTPDFKSNYDACAIMVISDENLWIKAAFEKSDFGPGSAICGVTNLFTDDSNGWAIPQDYLWLQMCRVGNVFAMHFSLDGETYYVCRVFRLEMPSVVKVGLEAQCPTGDGGYRTFSDVELCEMTVNDIRAGK